MKEEQIKRAVAAVAETEAGQMFFRYLHGICGYAEDNLVVGGGRVDPVATTVNEARRRLYVQIRRYVPVEQLKKIEYPAGEEPSASPAETPKEEKR